MVPGAKPAAQRVLYLATIDGYFRHAAGLNSNVTALLLPTLHNCLLKAIQEANSTPARYGRSIKVTADLHSKTTP